jgi:hypothetical protein
MLAEVWSGDEEPQVGTPQGGGAHQRDKETIERLPWEPDIEPLSPDLQLVLAKVERGEKMDTKSFLEMIPQFSGFKVQFRRKQSQAGKQGLAGQAS